MVLAAAATFIRLAISAGLGLVATVSMLGAMSCSAHAAVGGSSSGQAMSSAAALGSLTMACVFLGGLGAAVRVCSLALAVSLMAAHLWMSAATAPDLVALADRMMAGLLMPARRVLDLGPAWDCVFLGPADALYMLAALRHAASVIGSMRSMAAASLAALGAAAADPARNPPALAQ